MLTTTWKRHRKFKRNLKNRKPARIVILCDLVTRRSNRIGLRRLFWKTLLRTDLPHTKFYGFQPKRARSWPNHRIVCLNKLVLCTCVRIGMANNVANWSFCFLCTKNTLFIFWTPEMCDFMKQLPSHCLITAPAKFSKILGHYGCTIHHTSKPVAFLRNDREKDKFLPIR